MYTGPLLFDTADTHRAGLVSTATTHASTRAAPRRRIRSALGLRLVAIGERVANGRPRPASGPVESC